MVLATIFISINQHLVGDVVSIMLPLSLYPDVEAREKPPHYILKKKCMIRSKILNHTGKSRTSMINVVPHEHLQP